MCAIRWPLSRPDSPVAASPRSLGSPGVGSPQWAEEPFHPADAGGLRAEAGVAPGSIYGTTAAAVAVPQRPLGEWNEFTIRVVHQSYAVALNGYDVATYENRDPGRGAPAPAFVGLQSYPGSRVGFRKIRIKPLRQPCRPTELAARRRPGRAAGHPGDHQLRLGREQPQLAEDPLDRLAGAVGGRR